MSWLSTIKKFFKEEKKEESGEAITFSQILEKLNKEMEINQGKKRSVSDLLDKKFSQFNLQILEQIKILESIDIEKRKDYEKIKVVVKDNLKLYLNYLNSLIFDLENIGNLDVENRLKKTYEILNNFKRFSRQPYEKATILIGKEMEIATNIVNALLADLNQIYKENKENFEKIDSISKIKDSLEKADEIKTYAEEIKNSIIKSGNSLEEIKKKKENIEREILSVKESEQYKKDLDEKEKMKKSHQDLEKEIQILKQKFDLKSLAKHFHSEEKKTKLIKAYLENFKQALEKDEELELKKILEERGVKADLEDIKKRIIDLTSPVITESDKKISNFEEELNKLKQFYLNIEKNILQEEKKIEKMNAKKQSLIEEIKSRANQLFGVEIKN